MSRIVWTFGLMAGALLAASLAVSMLFQEQIGFDNGAVIGYTSMLVSFLMVYFGVRAYRDGLLGGAITFGRAFRVGALITVVASACYVATWQVLLRTVAQDFAEKYSAYALEKAKANGATAAELETQAADLAKFQESYKNPFYNVGITFLEPLPVGLLLTLVSAGALSRRKSGAAAPPAVTSS